MKRVVITGMGVVSPLGGTVAEQADALDAGRHGLRAMPEWPREDFDGSREAHAVLKSLTSGLIGRFAVSAERATVERWGPGPLTRYGADLELFVEKRFGDKVSLRLSAANLLDASKDEFFHKFDNLPDQLDRDYDEYELETEEAGPSMQLVVRWAF